MNEKEKEFEKLIDDDLINFQKEIINLFLKIQDKYSVRVNFEIYTTVICFMMVNCIKNFNIENKDEYLNDTLNKVKEIINKSDTCFKTEEYSPTIKNTKLND